jgi:hypothetical protein
MVQHVVAIAGNIEIRQAIVIVVSHRDGISPTAPGEASSLGHIGEVNLACAAMSRKYMGALEGAMETAWPVRRSVRGDSSVEGGS